MASDKLVWIILLMLCGIAWASCSSALYVPTEEHASASVTLEDLSRGRQLYIQHCGSCHALKLPTRYSEADWQRNLDEMQQRAKLSDQDKRRIHTYLSAGIAFSNRTSGNKK